MINTLRFICTLNEKQQEVVRDTIRESLVDNELPKATIETMANRAMDGRLSDLEDNIDVEELIKKLEVLQ